MGKYNNTAEFTGTYGGVENTMTSNWVVCDTGNFFVKTGDRIFGDVGNIITYTLSLITGDNVADDARITDHRDEGLEFVEGSVVFNGEPQECNIDDFLASLTYEPNSSYEIKYQALRVSVGN